MGREAHHFEEGQRFGNLTVICRTAVKDRDSWWHCLCDCGLSTEVRGHSLKASLKGYGGTKSCGCLRAGNATRIGHAHLTHGQSSRGNTVKASRTYISYNAMRGRCHNPNDPSYENYGAKGISVCKAWRDDFRCFLNDVGERPPNTSIDRIDRRFGYFMANCRWATSLEQNAPGRREQRHHLLFPYIMLEKARQEVARLEALCRR